MRWMEMVWSGKEMTDSRQREAFLCLDETFFDGFWELTTPCGGLGWVGYFGNKELGLQ
jgi:hypothetical protein